MDEKTAIFCAKHAASCASACKHLVAFLWYQPDKQILHFNVGSRAVEFSIKDMEYTEASNYLVRVLGEETTKATAKEQFDAMVNRYINDPSVDISRFIPGRKK